MMYHDAIGVERDPVRRGGLVADAAELGDADAQAMLGAAHHLGSGVALDQVAALMWLLTRRGRAAARLAAPFLGPVQRRLSPDEIAEAERLAAASARRKRRGMIVGTAGHIDHGKTALIKAADRRRRRPVEGGESARHHDRSRLRLSARRRRRGLGLRRRAGPRDASCTPWWRATGIDFVLLVVAADDGVKPQTLRTSGDPRSARHSPAALSR